MYVPCIYLKADFGILKTFDIYAINNKHFKV
jgi:hypothetical protein